MSTRLGLLEHVDSSNLEVAVRLLRPHPLAMRDDGIMGNHSTTLCGAWILGSPRRALNQTWTKHDETSKVYKTKTIPSALLPVFPQEGPEMVISISKICHTGRPTLLISFIYI